MKKLEHEFTKKGWNGIIDVGVIITEDNDSKKQYTYYIKEEKTVKTFLFFLTKKWYGKALTLLNKNNLKPEGI